MEPADVAVEVVGARGAGGGRGSRRLHLRLEWRRGSPLAVQVLVAARPDHPSQPGGAWSVLRDFLRYGLEEPTGDGDVRVEPAEEKVRLVVDRARPCSVLVPAALLRAFLDATEELVPSGTEASGAAVDDLLRQLLRRSDGDDG